MQSVIRKIAVGIAMWAVISMALVLPKAGRIGSGTAVVVRLETGSCVVVWSQF